MRRVLLFVGLAVVTAAWAQEGSVVSTVHNLSVTGPGEIRALNETEVCKFCHIPHSAVVAEPLWGHELSSAQYAVPQVRGAAGKFESAPQPDGASRLCLSCHDGTVALGEIGGSARPIRMAGSQRLSPGHRGYLGTDLSGSHPVSMVVRDTPPDAADRDVGLRPLASIKADRKVKLDKQDKMQCTACHDPHVDTFYVEGQVPRFWVKPTVGEVCLTCHEVR